ncbi:MAG: hypothetical protein ACXVAG_17045 [Vulcanimicrobiaceae bacterium]
MTITSATCYVESPFSATIEFAEAGLKQRPGLAVSPGSALSEEIRVRLRVVDDETDEVRKHDALEIRWSPKH